MAKSNNDFQQLVKEWYSGEGKDARTGGKELFEELKKYVNEFMKKINDVDEDYAPIGEQGCSDIAISGKELTQDNGKKWCSFLLQNLWRMEMLKKGNTNMVQYKKALQEFVQCQVMRAWSYIFKDMYCEVDKSLPGIFSKLKQLCTTGGIALGCGAPACEYGPLDPMDVGSSSVLNYIFEKMGIGIPVFIKKYGILFKTKCNTTQAGQKTSTQLDDSQIRSLIDQIRQEILSGTASVSSPTAKNQYDALADALVACTLCSGEKGKINLNFNGNDKELCKAMVKIFMYINGLKIGGYFRIQELKSKRGQEDVDPYLRCLVGRAALIRWLGGHSSKKKVAQTVVRAVKEWRNIHNVQDVYQKCTELNIGTTSIGGENIWRIMEKWAEDKKGPKLKSTYVKRGIQKLENVYNQGRPKGHAKSRAMADPPTSIEEKKILAELFAVQNEGQVEKLVQDAEAAAASATSPGPGGVAGVGTPAAAKSPTPEECIKNNSDKDKLCERLKCMKDLWLKATAGQGNNDTFWGQNGDVKKLWDELAKKMKETNGNGKVTGNGQCDSFPTEAEKTACKYLYAGFQELYKDMSATPAQPASSSNPLLDNPSFRQTMGCFLLHAYAKHMKEKAVCDIEKGITQAFNAWKNPESKAPTACNGSNASGKGQCVPCQWQENILETCTIKTNNTSGNTAPTEVKKKLTQVQSQIEEDANTTLKNINKMEKLCDGLKCIASRVNSSTTQNNFWETDVKKLWKELVKAMEEKDTNGQTECNQLENPSDKTACNYLHAGLTKLYQTTTSSGNILSKHPSLRQAMGCLLLHSYAKKMKGEAKCVIDAGINKAFSLWKDPKDKASSICNDNGNDKGPCVPCQWNENGNLESCLQNITIRSTTPTQTAKDKVEEMVGGNEPNTKSIIENINTMTTLCEHMKCIASHLSSTNAKQNADTFWGQNGDVKKLWDELSTAMKGKENDNGNGVCAVMGENGKTRTPTEPEKKACNYLHAGFTKLKDITANGTSTYSILSEHTSFVQTMGCFLLKEYAKQMQSQSKCVIDSGLKEAFKSWNENKGTSCTGYRPCIECTLEDNIGNCTTGTPQTPVKDKLKTVLPADGDPNLTTTLTKINETNSLCEKLKCAAPKWFQNQISGGSGGTTTKKTWSTFWEKEVKDLWDELAEGMKTNGVTDDKGNGCDRMEEGTTGSTAIGRDATNPEKKACNYLYAGLKELYKTNGATATSSSSGTISLKDNPLLRQTVGCLLLHAYAKKMKEDSKCVIDSGIQKAFKAFKDSNKSSCTNGSSCIECEWNEKFDDCTITTSGTQTEKIEEKLTSVQPEIIKTSSTTTKDNINLTPSLCDQLKCAAPKWFENQNKLTGSGGTGTANKTWCDFWGKDGVKSILQNMFNDIEDKGKNSPNKTICQHFGDGNEHSVERKACNHITAGLKYIKQIPNGGSGPTSPPNEQYKQLLARAVGCIALNMYADEIIKLTDKNCPIDENTIQKMFEKWNENNSCSVNGGSNNNNCFKCQREEISANCHLSVADALVEKNQNVNCNTKANEVKIKMDGLLEDGTIKMKPTLSTINKMTTFCTRLQCAAKQYHTKKNNIQSSGVNWNDMNDHIDKELKALLKQMMDTTNQEKVAKYCNDSNNNWDNGTKEGKTNKAACLLFASGLKHIYGRGRGHGNGPSFGQTMGCLFLKEYAKQLKKMAKEKKKHEVHPLCSIEEGINYAFGKSKDIMQEILQCDKNGTNSCFECTQKEDDYKYCQIGKDKVQDKVNELFKEKTRQGHMKKILANTLCPILPMDLLTPFLPLAPVSIGLSAMAYYLWKYFGPLGKGGPRFRRSPTEIPGPSVQEQVLRHVDEGAAHEYRLVKERKPRSAPTRTKRSGPVNRRTIIEIHFEVLDECQKGNTQLNQKDFLELLVQEFMGSEFMEEEQVSKEEVLMEDVPLERVPIEEVPSLGSGLMV
ncbi:SICAvar, type I [Plasmodium knowlesi strain H]|uniref:SICAvar, type I n=1 Tax=Plasmodium knowlesi (strain H) TaxID=5851 RepID=A0A1A7VWM9_PLAKH|nr:SICAvar, type I [Plasmodium knowlesi strain H]